MRIITILLAAVAISIPALAQVKAVPTFTITTNDVVQSSILVFGAWRTNGIVKYEFTRTGSKRLEEFYRAHPVGQEVRYRVGRFERVFKIDDRKNFAREGICLFSAPDFIALEDGLRGQK
jgi:hypothetical protein